MIDPALATRFAADLDRLVDPKAALGIGVSGGPDSLALLLLAAQTRPGQVLAATVDHALRPESGEEARLVADICSRLGVAHRTLPIDWRQVPQSAIQESARRVRYAALGDWAQSNGLNFVATGHHADDQAETLMMRLTRGAGVRGLAAMRASAPLPGRDRITLVRPLLGWRRRELGELLADAGLSSVDDPSNRDPRFERIRMRGLLAREPALDAAALAQSAGYLADAEAALDWATTRALATVEDIEGRLTYDPQDVPHEIRRRVIERLVAALASEGGREPLRGAEIDRILTALAAGQAATLRGVKLTGGARWTAVRAPPRRP